MDNRFELAVAAGTMMSASGAAVRCPHRWIPEGVTVEANFTGGHLLPLAAGDCALYEVSREAAALGIVLNSVRVTTDGGFDPTTWQSRGVDYSVAISCDASADQFAHLLEVVDKVAEIPQVIRAGATVRRFS